MRGILGAGERWGVLIRHAACCGVLVAPALSAAELHLQIIDRDTGRPVAARVRVRDDTLADHVPPNVGEVPMGADDRWFISSGRTKLTIPAGSIELRVERGLEYVPYKSSLAVSAEGRMSHVVELKRWIDMRDRGYVSGENHLHVPLAELGPMLVAEDLDFGTSLQWWNGQRLEVPPGKEHIRALEFAGTQVPTSVFDYEIERDWGAVYVVGQPQPLQRGDIATQPNLITLRKSHAAGALVCYQGGWSREVLLDALLGCVDVVNVCNNNFLRHAYQPRSEYSNLLDIDGFTTYPATPVGMMEMNTATYYRLLNCGLQLAAGAGSATGPKRTPVGYNRSYVRVSRTDSLPGFLEAWRAGRNFVTNGPMLFLQVGDRRPGDTIALDAGGGHLEARVEAISDQPITSIEVVMNGKVVGQHQPGDAKAAAITVPLTIREGSWVAARCTVEDRLLSDMELAAYNWGSRQRPRRPTRLRFAHTSPVYITVEGRLAHIPDSVTEASQMLEAFVRFAQVQCDQQTMSGLMEQVTEARARLRAGDK